MYVCTDSTNSVYYVPGAVLSVAHTHSFNAHRNLMQWVPLSHSVEGGNEAEKSQVSNPRPLSWWQVYLGCEPTSPLGSVLEKPSSQTLNLHS